MGAAVTVAQVMTRCPVSVRETASCRHVAAALSSGRIGALPVIDEAGRPVGMVSTVDLLRAGLRADRALAEVTAGEVMSRPVDTVGPDEELAQVARRLAGVRRLFVVENGRLIGVLTRSDLLRGSLHDDEEIRVRVEHAMSALSDQRAEVRAAVTDGTVLLVGRVEYRSALPAVEQLARAVPGVVEVRNRVSYHWDDEARKRAS